MADPSVAKRLRLALDMFEVAEGMQRQRLTRAQPAASEAEIDAEVQAWRRQRPGALQGDCPGRLSRRFE